MCLNGCSRLQGQPSPRAAPPCSGTGAEQHRADAAHPGGEAAGSCSSAAGRWASPLCCVIHCQIKHLLNHCLAVVCAAWGGYLDGGFSSLASSQPTHEEREKQAKGTSIMAKVLYYVHTTPATLHRARTRICYFTYQYKVTVKKHKALLGPRLSTGGEARG